MTSGAWFWIKRSLILVGALLGIWGVSATAVHSVPRLADSAIVRLLGVESTDARLLAIADRVATSRGIASQDELAWVRNASISRPLSALPYYIVAVSAYAGDRNYVRSLIHLSLKRDPRLSPAIFWLFDDRLAANDVPAATRALIQLIVLNPQESRFVTLLTQIAAIPEARAIIKRGLVKGAEWRGGFMNALGSSSLDSAAAFELFDVAGRPGSTAAAPPPTTIVERSAFIQSLLARRDYERAYLAWTLWLPPESQDATGYVFDGGFLGRKSLPPFGWDLSNGAGGAVTIDKNGGLAVDYSGTDGAVLAKQTLLLPPGHYRATTRATFQPVSADEVAPLVWRIVCLPESRDLIKFAIPLTGKDQRAGSDAFEVPASCPAQILTLEAGSADFAKQLTGKIHSVAIEAAR